MGAADLMPPPEGVNHMRSGGLVTTLESVAKRLLDTQVAGFQGEVPGWIGEAADAYTESIRTLGRRVREISASIGVCASSLDEWAVQVGDVTVRVVPDLHRQYDQAQEEYRRRLQVITTELLDPAVPMTQEEYDQKVEEFATERIAVQDAVLAEYKKVMTDLDDLAARVATAMQTVLDQEIGVEGWTGGGGNRTELATHLFDDIPVVDGQAEYELAREQAKEASEYFDDHGTLDADRVLEFYDKYKDRLGDPFFAAALNEYVTPEQVLQFLSDADHLRFGQGSESGYHDVFDSLAAGLGHVFVVSTGGFDAEGDPRVWEAYQAAKNGFQFAGGVPRDEYIERQLERWEDAARSELTFEGGLGYDIDPGYKGRHFVSHRGYEYLGLMLGAASEKSAGLALGEEFFDKGKDDLSLAQKIVLMEQEFRRRGVMESGAYGTGEGDGPLGGGRVPSSPVDGMLSLMDEPSVPTVGSYGIPVTWQGFEEIDAQRYDTVQRFMLDEVPQELNADGSDGNCMSMARFLAGERWEKHFSPEDEGHALGKVLADITNPLGKYVLDETVDGVGAWKDSREGRAAMVAADFMEGYQEGLEKSGINLETGRHDFGEGNRALRNWAGQILAPYVSDMGESIAMNIDEDTTVAGEGVGVELGILKDRPKLVVSADFLARLRGEDGLFMDLALDDRVDVRNTPDVLTDDVNPYVNPPASEVLMNAALRGYDEDLKWAFRVPVEDAPVVSEGIRWIDNGERLPDSRQPSVEKVINNSAAFLALMGASDGEAGVALGEAQDAMNRRSKAMAKFVLDKTNVSSLFDLGPDLNPWADRAYHVVGNELLDQIFTEDAASEARVERADEHDSLEQTMKQILLSNMYEGGRLTGYPADPGQVPPSLDLHLRENHAELGSEGLPERWWSLPRDVRERYVNYISQIGLADPGYSQLVVEIDEKLNGGAAEYFEEFDKRQER